MSAPAQPHDHHRATSLSRRDRNEPRYRVGEAERAAVLPDGPAGLDERFAGWGVMGLPWRSGHYLALRHFTSSIGPVFRSVWHRDPAGRWVMVVDTEARNSCPRYFGAQLDRVESAPIEVCWNGSRSFTVTIPGYLRWTVNAAPTVSTRLLTSVGSAMPEALWRRDRVLRAMAPAAGGLLTAGRLAMSGTATNGQAFQAHPRRLWSIPDSSAVIDGTDLGPVGPLARQDRLGDFRLPQRGILAVGDAAFEAYDATRHSDAVTRRPEGPTC